MKGAVSVSPKSPIPALQDTFLYLSPVFQFTNPIQRVLPYDPITPQRLYLQLLSHWELGLSISVLRRCKHSVHSTSPKHNIVKIAVSLQLAIPIRISADITKEINQLILNFILNCRGLITAEIILKKNKVEGILCRLIRYHGLSASVPTHLLLIPQKYLLHDRI